MWTRYEGHWNILSKRINQSSCFPGPLAGLFPLLLGLFCSSAGFRGAPVRAQACPASCCSGNDDLHLYSAVDKACA